MLTYACLGGQNALPLQLFLNTSPVPFIANFTCECKISPAFKITATR